MKTNFTIHPIPALKDNYIWIIVNNEEKTALVVDPGEAAPVIHYLNQQQLNLCGILITHHHWDHTNGLKDLLKNYDPPVFASIKSQVAGVTNFIRDKDIVRIDTFPEYQVMEIPGHTLDHIAYYSTNTLFCGDTLFSAGCGRIFEGTAEQMYFSLQKIVALPSETKIYCGHEYTLNNLNFAKTVEPNNQQILKRIQAVENLFKNNLPSLPTILYDELEINPFFRCHSLEVIKAVQHRVGRRLECAAAVFSELRKWKDTF